MLIDLRDKIEICQVLKSFVEEWGHANVVVSVPMHWKDAGITDLGKVRLEFKNVSAIEISVPAAKLCFSKTTQNIADPKANP